MDGATLGIATPADQAGVLEDFEVLRDRLDRHFIWLGELVHRGITIG
jgi:hypothetical protein